MLILWLLWQPLLDKACLKLYLLKIFISLPRRRRRRSKFTRSWSGLARWIIWSCFSRKVLYLMRRERQTRYGGKLIVSSCLMSKSCTNIPFQDYICSVSIPKQWCHFWRSCMRGSVEVIQGAGHYPIRPLPRGIGGQVCKKKHRSM